MGNSNHSKKGEGKNAWYRRRNILRTENQVTRSTTMANYIKEQEEKKEAREASMSTHDRALKASLERLSMTDIKKHSQPSLFSRAKNFLKGKFRHRG